MNEGIEEIRNRVKKVYTEMGWVQGSNYYIDSYADKTCCYLGALMLGSDVPVDDIRSDGTDIGGGIIEALGFNPEERYQLFTMIVRKNDDGEDWQSISESLEDFEHYDPEYLLR